MDEKWINLWQRNVVKLHWRSLKSFGFVYLVYQLVGWYISPRSFTLVHLLKLINNIEMENSRGIIMRWTLWKMNYFDYHFIITSFCTCPFDSHKILDFYNVFFCVPGIVVWLHYGVVSVDKGFSLYDRAGERGLEVKDFMVFPLTSSDRRIFKNRLN